MAVNMSSSILILSCHTSIFHMHPHTSHPITITITNKPITHASSIVISSTSHTQTCAYSQSFTSNHALQIALETDSIHFTQFEVTYTYDTANDSLHTTHPTSNENHRIISLITADTGAGPFGINEIVILLAVILLLCCICICVFVIVYKVRSRTRRPDRIHVHAHSDPAQRAQVVQKPQSHVVVMVEDEATKQQKNMDHAILASWLENEVGLPHYYPLFVANGFDSIKFVKGLQKKSQLKQIGIDTLGHQTLIWGEIKKLKAQDLKNTGTPTFGPANTYGTTPTFGMILDGRQSTTATDTGPKPRHGEPGRRYKNSESEWVSQAGELPPSMLKKKSSGWGSHRDLPPSMTSKQISFFGRMKSVFKDGELQEYRQEQPGVQDPAWNTGGFIQ
eukprot:245387_1